MLLGEEPPNHGKILTAENLRVVYFEQNRESLDPDITVGQTVAPKGEHVQYQGRFIHVRSYLGRFLFRNEQIEMTVGKLSGGEQSRLVLARLMLREADVLVLDEPTNDLDVATLNVLEECLEEFPGALLLVTHDRYFLDQVANQIVAFPPKWAPPGQLVSFADLAQWEAWHDELEVQRKQKPVEKKAEPAAADAAPKKRKLSFKEQREYDTMEATIQKTEETIAGLNGDLADPANASNATKLRETYEALEKNQAELDPSTPGGRSSRRSKLRFLLFRRVTAVGLHRLLAELFLPLGGVGASQAREPVVQRFVDFRVLERLASPHAFQKLSQGRQVGPQHPRLLLRLDDIGELANAVTDLGREDFLGLVGRFANRPQERHLLDLGDGGGARRDRDAVSFALEVIVVPGVAVFAIDDVDVHVGAAGLAENLGELLGPQPHPVSRRSVELEDFDAPVRQLFDEPAVEASERVERWGQ